MFITILNLVALWIVGVLLSVGFFLALRDKTLNTTVFLGVIWSVLFSYAFFSWMLAKLFQLLFIDDNRAQSTDRG